MCRSDIFIRICKLFTHVSSHDICIALATTKPMQFDSKSPPSPGYNLSTRVADWWSFKSDTEWAGRILCRVPLYHTLPCNVLQTCLYTKCKLFQYAFQYSLRSIQDHKIQRELLLFVCLFLYCMQCFCAAISILICRCLFITCLIL
jgi:hypothetical protein